LPELEAPEIKTIAFFSLSSISSAEIEIGETEFVEMMVFKRHGGILLRSFFKV
jgi:hypothetical protein